MLIRKTNKWLYNGSELKVVLSKGWLTQFPRKYAYKMIQSLMLLKQKIEFRKKKAVEERAQLKLQKKWIASKTISLVGIVFGSWNCCENTQLGELVP